MLLSIGGRKGESVLQGSLGVSVQQYLIPWNGYRIAIPESFEMLHLGKKLFYIWYLH